MHTLKALFLIVLLAACTLATAQNTYTSNQDVITSLYDDGLNAKYSVVVAPGKGSTVVCQFKNRAHHPFYVVLTITNASGGARQVARQIDAGQMYMENIGDIASVSVSVAGLKNEEALPPDIVSKTVLKENISKTKDKLSSTKFAKGSNAAAKQAAPAAGNVVLTDKHTRYIFELVFGQGTTKGMSFTEQDHRMAEYFLREIIDGSCKMSVVEVLAANAYSFDPGILDMVNSMLKNYREKCDEGAKKGKYYDKVVLMVKRNYKSGFENRKNPEINEWLTTPRK